MNGHISSGTLNVAQVVAVLLTTFAADYALPSKTLFDVLTSHTMYGKTDFACVRSVLVGQDHGDD